MRLVCGLLRFGVTEVTDIKVCSVEHIVRSKISTSKVTAYYTEAVLSGPDGRQTVRKEGFWCDRASYPELRKLYVRHTDLAV